MLLLNYLQERNQTPNRSDNQDWRQTGNKSRTRNTQEQQMTGTPKGETNPKEANPSVKHSVSQSNNPYPNKNQTK